MASRKKFSLRGYFDRVVLVNLPRRPDRLAQARRALEACDWPFRQPEIFAAVDGRTAALPAGWRFGRGAWGCLQSHAQILTRAIADGVDNILVLEDDICFQKNFRKEVEKFLRRVPEDWDQLMLGGQHLNRTGEPALVQPGVLRCTDCERTHCYAIRGEFMRKLCERWQGGGKFGGLGHCDCIMGRDPELQFAHKVYAPVPFLVGQERGKSDIYGMVQPRKFWNFPGPELSVVNLHAPAEVAVQLFRCGFYFRKITVTKNKSKHTLNQVFTATARDPAARLQYLGEWIKVVQWEVAGDPAFVCTVWHPEATPELVKAASLWQVYEVTADTVAGALRQLPRKLQDALRVHENPP
jgi:hypothetical protein